MAQIIRLFYHNKIVEYFDKIVSGRVLNMKRRTLIRDNTHLEHLSYFNLLSDSLKIKSAIDFENFSPIGINDSYGLVEELQPKCRRK